MRLTKATSLIIIAISVPIAIELRTVAGFFNIELPLIAVAIIEFLFLGLMFVLYGLYGEKDNSVSP
ncbi:MULTISPECIES: CbaC protein [Haloferax]|uniref:CbaC protein n=1 Tax=Haloferax marinum TaxID=2666143 RepID=A0A6A8G3T0_9EURY|nr:MULTISPECIES: CbaC protein [Haloferax]KAB1196838.1 CbaC protein [Haloferax sp. CBA1150]MRW95850.1 CbaC protein [Haloferax marinum]